MAAEKRNCAARERVAHAGRGLKKWYSCPRRWAAWPVRSSRNCRWCRRFVVYVAVLDVGEEPQSLATRQLARTKIASCVSTSLSYQRPPIASGFIPSTQSSSPQCGKSSNSTNRRNSDRDCAPRRRPGVQSAQWLRMISRGSGRLFDFGREVGITHHHASSCIACIP